MKRQFAIFAFVAASMVLASCGGASTDGQNDKIKAETIALEEAATALDSTSFEIKQTSASLDAILNQL
jgi:predicted small secreted protein